jgi:UrcA family protein
MFKQVIAPVLAIAATVVVFSIPHAAMAAPETNTVTVTIADLNLNTAAGQQKLDRRLDNAARKVCGMNEIRTGTLIRPHAVNECYRLALRDVRAHVATVVTGNRSGF